MNNMKFNFLIYALIANTLFCCNVKSQDSLKTILQASNYPELRIKLNSKIFLGEIPLGFEYRANKGIGIDLSVSYIYLSLIPGSRKLTSDGYKASLGIKKYFNENAKNRTFYIHTNLLYKQIYSKDRFFTDDGVLGYFGRGGSQNMYNEYYYNLKREVIALSLLVGWDLKMKYHIFEIYFGAGYRQVKDFREITEWESYPGVIYDYNSSIILPTEKQLIKYYPSLHFGFCWSFDLTSLFFRNK